MEDQLQNQSLPSQGKNQKASEGWFDLITQIALDYRRLSQVNECVVAASVRVPSPKTDKAEEVLIVN